MKTAIWFSRHQPTGDQIADALGHGYTITRITEGVSLGTINLADKADVWRVSDSLHAGIIEAGAVAVFGVFPSPLRSFWFATPHGRTVTVWEAWNVSRTVEGKPATFAHREWMQTM